jgi:signal peptidase I
MDSKDEKPLAGSTLQGIGPASSSSCGASGDSDFASTASLGTPGAGSGTPHAEAVAYARPILETPNTNGSSLRNEVRVWTRDLLIAIGLALVIIVFLYQPVKVEGTSMAPLLSDQERIFINKFVYRFSAIERGDVVVFWYPLDRSKSFIKRVIGLPGDTLEMRQGTLYVNGKATPEPYVPLRYEDFSNFGPVTVPRESYFVMGDHRISSNDSRMFGAVENKFIYGRAVFAYWPVDHFGSLAITDAQSK